MARGSVINRILVSALLILFALLVAILLGGYYKLILLLVVVMIAAIFASARTSPSSVKKKGFWSGTLKFLRLVLAWAVIIFAVLAVIFGIIYLISNGVNLHGTDPVTLEKIRATTPLNSFEINGESWQTQSGMVSIDGKNFTNETRVLVEDNFNTMRIYGHNDAMYLGQSGTWVNVTLGYREAPFNIKLKLYGPCQVRFTFVDMESNGNAFHPGFPWDYVNTDSFSGASLNLRLKETSFKVEDEFQGNKEIYSAKLDKGLSFDGRNIGRKASFFIQSGENTTIREVKIK